MSLEDGPSSPSLAERENRKVPEEVPMKSYHYLVSQTNLNCFSSSSSCNVLLIREVRSHANRLHTRLLHEKRISPFKSLPKLPSSDPFKTVLHMRFICQWEHAISRRLPAIEEYCNSGVKQELKDCQNSKKKMKTGVSSMRTPCWH